MSLAKKVQERDLDAGTAAGVVREGLGERGEDDRDRLCTRFGVVDVENVSAESSHSESELR
jgi:hypothetical protein